ncbi:MAG TPA: hypothetical protein VK395_28165 [Gemmataceae bacterium]|nr:hypothetical protein [Gemmataceae bacterium]
MPSSVIYQIEVPNPDGPSKLLEHPAPRTLANLRWTQCPSGPNEPYTGYLPEVVQAESGKLLMGFQWRNPSTAPDTNEYGYAYSLSDESGMVWEPPRWASDDSFFTDKPVVTGSLGLAAIRPGLLTLNAMAGHPRWFATNAGRHWYPGQNVVLPQDLLPGFDSNPSRWEMWHPILIDRDAGNVTRLTETRWYRFNDPSAGRVHCRAVLWHSYPDQNGEIGQKWEPSSLVLPKEWIGVSEVCLVRAKNNDLVAAVRTEPTIDPPQPGDPTTDGSFDEYSGLGFSRSADNGATWSPVRLAYPYGRYHSSLVVLDDGTIVCCHVNNHTYIRSPDGLPRFGVEALVSKDHGYSWDFDHRYILWAWKGLIQGNPLQTFYSGAWGTSSIVLGSGEILTVFGTGYRNTGPNINNRVTHNDFYVVRWKVDPTLTYDPNGIFNKADVYSYQRNNLDPTPIC